MSTENKNTFGTRVNSRIFTSCVVIGGLGFYLGRKFFFKTKRNLQEERISSSKFFSSKELKWFFIGSSLYPLIYSMILYNNKIKKLDHYIHELSKQTNYCYRKEYHKLAFFISIVCGCLSNISTDDINLKPKLLLLGSITANSLYNWYKNENNIFLLTDLVLIITNCMIYYQIRTHNYKVKQPINYKLNEEKRITRIKKSNLCKVLPVIFEQTMTKLKILNDKTILQLKTQLTNELNNDINLLREYKIEINDTNNNNNYIGLAMIKFKEDINDDSYIYIACWIQIVQKGGINNIDINDMKNKLDRELNAL